MFEHMTLTLAQQDGPPPPPAINPVATPAAPSAAPGAPAATGTQAPAQGQADSAAPGTHTTGANGQAIPAKPKPSPFGDPIMIIALAVLAFMFFFTMSSSRKEKKKRAAMTSSLKKGSKVRTIGGMIGTIVEVRDDNTLVIKVDENANTRIKFDRSAGAAVLDDKAD
jgi:preprotein translocase subunit YajC